AQPGLLRVGGDRVHRLAGRGLVRSTAPVEGHDRALVLEPNAAAMDLLGVVLVAELVDPSRPLGERGVEDRLGPAGAQELRPMRAEIRDRADRDHRPGLGGATAGYA